MRKRILLVVDNSKRELFSYLLLSRYLGSMGFKPIICSVHSFRYYYLRYLPEAMVWPNGFYNLSKFAKSTTVFILPSESSNGQPGLIRSTHCGTEIGPVHAEYVAKFFCWGKAMRRILAESGVWKDEQLFVTGSPSTDHWLLAHESAADRRNIGITTSFRAISNSAPMRKMNYFQWLDAAEVGGGDGNFYLPPQHAESWIFFEASLARSIVGLVRTLTAKCTETIEIRPHPLEISQRYCYLTKIFDGRINVSKKGTISEWLSNKAVLFTFISASALDSVIRGVPVVSLKGLMDPDAINKIPAQYKYPFEDMMWQIKEPSDIGRYLELSAKGRLRPCRDEKGISGFLEENFFFPRQAPSAELVASEIKRTLDVEDKRKNIFLSEIGGGRILKFARYALFAPFSLSLISLALYLWKLLPGKQGIGFTFQPWRFWERRAAGKTALGVWSAYHEAAGKKA